MRDFRKLRVWGKAHVLALEVYRNTRALPRSEIFGLQAQMRRSSVSVAANIAEGSGRSGRPELIQFLNMASGSASDLQYHLLLARDLGYLEMDSYDSMAPRVIEVKRMLTGLIQRVRAEHQRSAKLKTED